MTARRTAAIAGGGIIGTSIAWRLAQRGWQVTIFDQGEIGGEASWAGAGMLAPGGEIEETSELASLALDSRRLYPSFVEQLRSCSGLSIDFQECGAIDLAYSEEHWRSLKGRAANQEMICIRSKPISVDQVPVFWPRINTQGLTGALFYAEDAVVNPRDVMVALAGCCSKLGVQTRQHCAVRCIRVEENAAVVVTEIGTERFARAVISSGAWSSSICVTGAPPLPKSEPVKGHLIGYQQPAQTCGTIVRHGHTYLFQRSSGLLIAGASAERVGFDRSLSQREADRLAEEATLVFPHLRETAPGEVWAGFRPYSDALQIGRWHSDSLYLAYGHYRNGILLAPVTADLVAREFGETGVVH